MFKKGFTLAEVLITLLIIGIVAALTIPSVISNYQQQEFKTGLKKAVSVLNEAIQTNIAQEGETPYDNSNLFTYLQRHMSVIDANSNPNIVLGKGGDIASMKYTPNMHFYTADGIRFEMNICIGRSSNMKLHESGFTLCYSGDERMNGREYGCELSNSTSCHCGSYGLANNPNNTKFKPCVVLVDVNGDRKPNPAKAPSAIYWQSNGNIKYITTYPYDYPSVFDKKITDVFNILITEDKAIPFGVVAQRAMYSK